MSIHLSSGGAAGRRIVLSCDVPGCPVQLEPPPAERWRSDPDARAFARDHAPGWAIDLVRQTDFCPVHAATGAGTVPGGAPPRPTAAARDRAGDPLDRDGYAERLRAGLTGGTGAEGVGAGAAVTLTAGQAYAVARLLAELAGVYRGESLGTLAHELSTLIDGQSAPGPAR